MNYSYVIEKARFLDPGHHTTAEVHKTNEGRYPYSVIMVTGTGCHKGNTLVGGLGFEEASEVASLWNDGGLSILNNIITETDEKVQHFLEKSMKGESSDPDRTYAVGMSEAYNEMLHELIELRSKMEVLQK